MRIAWCFVLLAACTPSKSRMPPWGTPILGLPGYLEIQRPDPTHCGGLAVEVQRAPGVIPHPADAPLAAVLMLTPPHDRGHGSGYYYEEIDSWKNSFSFALGEALRAYGDVPTVIAAARLAQAARFASRLIEHAEIPREARGDDEKVAEFCNELAPAVTTFSALASNAEATCRSRAAHVRGGWWNTACAE